MNFLLGKKNWGNVGCPACPTKLGKSFWVVWSYINPFFGWFKNDGNQPFVLLMIAPRDPHLSQRNSKL